MNCPSCHQPVDNGAAFCGNCGQALQIASPTAQVNTSTPPSVSGSVTPAGTVAAPASPIAQNVANMPVAGPAPVTAGSTPLPVNGGANIPAYALANPTQHVGETKALLSVIFGVIGMICAIIPILGLALGITGIVMGTMSRQSTKRKLSTVGIVLSSVAIVAGLASWAYAIVHDPDLNPKAKSGANSSHQLPSKSTASTSLSTPCYSTQFGDKLNISHDDGSCDMAAFDGDSMATSNDLYKVYANKTGLKSDQGFTTLAKDAIEKDINISLPPGFSITSEKVSQFSGSPAYEVIALDKTKDIAVVETAVYHPVSNGENVFIMVHAVNGSSVDLKSLEAEWQWK